MKFKVKVSAYAICLCLFLSCSFGETKQNKNQDGEINKSAEIKTVTEPFKADFLGVYRNVIEGEESGCKEPYSCRVIVDFKGTGSHMENFAGTFEFCACGPDGEYGATKSYMVSTAGDTLIISCQGKVIPGKLINHPDFVNSYWKDPFKILGGTGKFKGATGGGMTNDYNSNEDSNSHHHWEGTITLVKK